MIRLFVLKNFDGTLLHNFFSIDLTSLSLVAKKYFYGIVCWKQPNDRVFLHFTVNVTSSTPNIPNIMGAFDGDRLTNVATDPSGSVFMYFQVVSAKFHIPFQPS